MSDPRCSHEDYSVNPADSILSCAAFCHPLPFDDILCAADHGEKCVWTGNGCWQTWRSEAYRRCPQLTPTIHGYLSVPSGTDGRTTVFFAGKHASSVIAVERNVSVGVLNVSVRGLYREEWFRRDRRQEASQTREAKRWLTVKLSASKSAVLSIPLDRHHRPSHFEGSSRHSACSPFNNDVLEATRTMTEVRCAPCWTRR